jgi:hypothetical protein
MPSRSIIIGDVHGCSRELNDLLALIGPTADDSVLFVGDLVARGPDSRGVVRTFREVRGKGVVGNHEVRVLEARRARFAGERGPELGPSHEAVLRDLGDEDWAALDALPLYLDLTEHDARIVHAGVVPGLPFAKQDAWTLTHIRSIAEDGTPSARFGAESWAARYRGSPHLVFGHDARRGLQLHAWATGLDTACVYGGSLTALVIPRGERLPFPNERRGMLVSVRAREPYCPVTPGPE